MIMMPLVIYGGFGRSVVISERKSGLLLVSHAQEILLHTFPLGLIVIINCLALKTITVFDWICIAILAANALEVIIEITVLKLYENININLELRSPMKSQTRVEDLFKITLISILFLATTLLVGFFAIPKEGCI